MSNVNIVFLVKEDSVNKIRTLPEDNRMDFIFCYNENDYFNEPFLTLMEINDQQVSVFQSFYMHMKDLEDVLPSYEILSISHNKGFMILIEAETIRELASYMETMLYSEYEIYYKLFINESSILEKDFSLFDFVYYLDTLKHLVFEAIYRKANLIFCIEKRYFKIY